MTETLYSEETFKNDIQSYFHKNPLISVIEYEGHQGPVDYLLPDLEHKIEARTIMHVQFVTSTNDNMVTLVLYLLSRIFFVA